MNPQSEKVASLFLAVLEFDTGLITECTKASRRGTTKGWSGVTQQQTCL